MKKWLIISSVIFVAIVVVFVARPDSSDFEFTSVSVTRGDLPQTVEETGSVEAGQILTYGWEVAGRVQRVHQKVGDTVSQGEVIAELRNARQAATLRERQAAVAEALARLELELAGPSDEDISESEAKVDAQRAKVDQARADLARTRVDVDRANDDAAKDVLDAELDAQRIDSAYVSQLVEDAYDDLRSSIDLTLSKLVRALLEADEILGVDNLLVNNDFEDDLADTNPYYFGEAKRVYKIASNGLVAAQQGAGALTLGSPGEGIDDVADMAIQVVADVQQALSLVQSVLSATTATVNITQSDLETFKNDISTQQTTVDVQEASLLDDQQAVGTAKNALQSAEIAYDTAVRNERNIRLKGEADITLAEAKFTEAQALFDQAAAGHQSLIVPPRNVDIASLRADVARAAAARDGAFEEFNQTRLIALGEGVITSLDVEVGETVSAQQNVLTIISSGLMIDVDISESDIAKVSRGDAVTITLDAFGDDVLFDGTVVTIEPAETEVSGVIYYNTDISLVTSTTHTPRSGMTANVTIHTDMRENVLMAPQRAVLFHADGSKFVRVVTNADAKQFEERPVTTGLVGDDGIVEIVSGLEQGEEIITFLQED
jgi:RND family efflux transporter MFP subunit